MNVTGYVGGPHQRSSFRESAHSSQTRAISASNWAVTVKVRASKSFFTSITAIPTAHRLRSSTLAPRDLSDPATAPRTGLDAAGSLKPPPGCLAPAARDHAVAWSRGPLVRERLHAFAPPRSSSGTAAPVPKRRARWTSSASRCPASSHPPARETDDQASHYLQPYGCRLSGKSRCLLPDSARAAGASSVSLIRASRGDEMVTRLPGQLRGTRGLTGSPKA